MKNWWCVPFLAVLVSIGGIFGEKQCGECDVSACVPPKDCLAGMVKDSCGCCFVCGKREGEQCDEDKLPLPYRNSGHGTCGEHLECRPRTDLPEGDPPEAVCVCYKSETLCGSDGVTYENECKLTEARYQRRDGLRAVHRGPCRSVPKIVSPPEDVSNKTGGYAAMSCEATGWPVPVVQWQIDRGDGNRIPLPSDDPKIAVQSRGGPGKYEVTGWLQILKLAPEDDASYWCMAKNEEGEAAEVARIIVLDANRDLPSYDSRDNDL